MEVCICKKLFTTVDIDVTEEEVTDEILSQEIKKIVDGMSLEDWDEYDWRGREVYEAYDTYGGIDIELDF